MLRREIAFEAATSRRAGQRYAVPLALAVVVGAGAVLIAGHRVSANAAYPADVVRKCRDDYKRLCPGYKLESEELDACMRSKHPSISSPCMNALVDAGLAPMTARRR